MQYYVYILTNTHKTVLYTGVTNDLVRRVYEHKNHLDKGSFTARYNVEKLVYYEVTSDVEAAIEREKQIKGWSRKHKNKLIESKNPNWTDLYGGLLSLKGIATPVTSVTGSQ
ncbi:MAG: GIY-YIG nuclease family protein [Oscillospiraceae bacterium]|nr:GIY-YIG nuclease family protein [Oscillospiraceae bacterium]